MTDFSWYLWFQESAGWILALSVCGCALIPLVALLVKMRDVKKVRGIDREVTW
jgi:hypothetical protein